MRLYLPGRQFHLIRVSGRNAFTTFLGFFFVNLSNSATVRTELQEYHGLTSRTVIRSTDHEHVLPLCRSCRKNSVYVDPQLGHFNYCSPRCRDEDVLPEYNKKLEEFIKRCTVASEVTTPQATAAQQARRQVELKKKPKEEFGVILSTPTVVVAQVRVCVCVFVSAKERREEGICLL